MSQARPAGEISLCVKIDEASAHKDTSACVLAALLATRKAGRAPQLVRHTIRNTLKHRVALAPAKTPTAMAMPHSHMRPPAARTAAAAQTCQKCGVKREDGQMPDWNCCWSGGSWHGKCSDSAYTWHNGWHLCKEQNDAERRRAHGDAQGHFGRGMSRVCPHASSKVVDGPRAVAYLSCIWCTVRLAVRRLILNSLGSTASTR